MVSPVYKAGYGAGSVDAVAPDGESLVFDSLGIFAGAPYAPGGEAKYLARRTPSGWVTTSLTAPPGFSAFDFSTDLSYEIAIGSPEATKGGVQSEGIEYVLHGTNGSTASEGWGELAGNYVLKVLGNMAYLEKGLPEGFSANLCHVFIAEAEGALLPEATKASVHDALYELSSAPAGGCREDGLSPLRMVDVKNALGPNEEPEPIDSRCEGEFGVGAVFAQGVQESSFNRFPVDGEEVLFSQKLGSCGTYQLFARLGGRRTIEVSTPQAKIEECGETIPCPGAEARPTAAFSGASEDGLRVFFTTHGRLVGEDGDTSNDLYLAQLGCPEGAAGCAVAERLVTDLVQVSHDPNPGQAAEVQGVVRIASDGSRVYFVAHGELAPNANDEGESAAQGAENLYVYERTAEHPGGSTRFVARLCSGPSLSGGVEDRRCPNTLSESGPLNDLSLWSFGQEVQSTADGGVLVFSTYARLVKSDTDEAKDVYRYDARTGALQRVSLGEAGHDTNGNNSAFDAGLPPHGGIDPGKTAFQEHGIQDRDVSADGSRIVFTTAEPLSASAVNGLVNVYEWSEGSVQGGEGSVSLVSNGDSPTNDSTAGISPSGRDIYLLTDASLVPQDVEEDFDVYDARLGGGFPVIQAERQPCSGDACQGPLTDPAPLLIPGSVPQAPGENAIASKAATGVKKKSKRHGTYKSKRGRRRAARARARRDARRGARGARR
jgi:hypothetical protein